MAKGCGRWVSNYQANRSKGPARFRRMAEADVTIFQRRPPCPMSGCGGQVSVPVPAGHGENRWVCPECLEPLEYSVSTGKLTTISRRRLAVVDGSFDGAAAGRRLAVGRVMGGTGGA
jgi:hypothetical protein